MGLPSCACVPPAGDDWTVPWLRECDHHKAQRLALEKALRIIDGKVKDALADLPVFFDGWSDREQVLAVTVFRLKWRNTTLEQQNKELLTNMDVAAERAASIAWDEVRRLEELLRNKV